MLSPELFWNTEDSAKERPANISEVISMSGEVKDLTGENTFIRSDLINAFSRLFSHQMNGKIGRVHNVCVVSETGVDLTPLLRAFFIDSLPSITRILLHGVLLVVHAKEKSERSSKYKNVIESEYGNKNFEKNLALCDAVFITSAHQLPEADKKLIESEIFHCNDRCFINHVPAIQFC